MNEAELLFSDILNCDRLSLYLNRDFKLDKDTTDLISGVLKRRILGEPVEYILGKTEFMGVEFKVSPDVFIPRPESEVLVEVVMKYAAGYKLQATSRNILDLGTGSGCIAVSLAKFLPDMRITASDISLRALEVARHNAYLNNVSHKIEFIYGNLFTQYSILNTQYDIIVSNPPYIPTEEINKLRPELQYEPRLALDGGYDGLDFYRRIIAESPKFIKPGGLLIMEMGFNQCQAIKNIFQKYETFEIIEIIKDYNNIDRVIVCRKSQITNSKSQISSNDQIPMT